LPRITLLSNINQFIALLIFRISNTYNLKSDKFVITIFSQKKAIDIQLPIAFKHYI